MSQKFLAGAIIATPKGTKTRHTTHRSLRSVHPVCCTAHPFIKY